MMRSALSFQQRDLSCLHDRTTENFAEQTTHQRVWCAEDREQFPVEVKSKEAEYYRDCGVADANNLLISTGRQVTALSVA